LRPKGPKGAVRLAGEAAPDVDAIVKLHPANADWLVGLRAPQVAADGQPAKTAARELSGHHHAIAAAVQVERGQLGQVERCVRLVVDHHGSIGGTKGLVDGTSVLSTSALSAPVLPAPGSRARHSAAARHRLSTVRTTGVSRHRLPGNGHGDQGTEPPQDASEQTPATAGSGWQTLRPARRRLARGERRHGRRRPADEPL
jgi:hypothetical protein